MVRIFSQFIEQTGTGLEVYLDRYGVVIKEVTDVTGVIDSPEARFLMQTRHCSWAEIRNPGPAAKSHTSGDDDSGTLRKRIIARAISLLAYWGGSEEFITDPREHLNCDVDHDTKLYTIR